MTNPEDELWNDVFDESHDLAFAAASRERMIAYTHRRLHRKKVIRLGMAGAAMCILLCLSVHLAAPARVSPLAAVSVRPEQNEPANPAVVQGAANDADVPIHFLTDEELLSRFPNRPLALIGSQHHRQELVFLDDPRSIRAAQLDHGIFVRR